MFLLEWRRRRDSSTPKTQVMPVVTRLHAGGAQPALVKQTLLEAVAGEQTPHKRLRRSLEKEIERGIYEETIPVRAFSKMDEKRGRPAAHWQHTGGVPSISSE